MSLSGVWAPGTVRTASATACTWSALATIMMGLEVSTMPWVSSSCWPFTESKTLVYCSVELRPLVSSLNRPQQATSSTTAVPIQT